MVTKRVKRSLHPLPASLRPIPTTVSRTVLRRPGGTRRAPGADTATKRAARKAGNRELGVYLMEEQGSGLIKIGLTEYRAKRMAELQAMRPGVLRYLGWIRCPNREIATKLERRLHFVLGKQKRRVFGEWFLLSSDEAKWVKAYAVAYLARISTENEPLRQGELGLLTRDAS